ncbi:hypothetical protein Tco_1324873, partial [Tanacetum coccineum]
STITDLSITPTPSTPSLIFPSPPATTLSHDRKDEAAIPRSSEPYQAVLRNKFSDSDELVLVELSFCTLHRIVANIELLFDWRIWKGRWLWWRVMEEVGENVVAIFSKRKESTVFMVVIILLVI